MKKINMWFFIILCGIFLGGCDNMVEIEDRDFIMTMLVSYEDSNYKVFFGLPNLSEETGQSTSEKDKNIISFTGENLYEVERKYSLQSDKKLDYSHLKAIIIDEKLGNNTEAIKEFLMYIKGNSEISRNTLTFTVMEGINEIVKMNSKVRDGVGSYMESLYKNTEGKGKGEEVTIGSIITAHYNKNEILTVPVIKVEEEMLMLDGAALYNGERLIGQISEEELVYINIAKGRGKKNRLFIDDICVLKIMGIKSKIEFSSTNKRLYCVIQINMDVENLEGKDILEDDVDRYIMLKLNNIIEKFYVQEKTDCLNLYRQTALKNSQVWNMYKDSHELFMEELTIGVSAKVKIHE